MGHAQLLRDLGKIVRRAFEMLRRSARDHFQVGDFGQPREDFILHAFTKVSVVRIAAQIVERQDGDRFVGHGGRRRLAVSALLVQRRTCPPAGDTNGQREDRERDRYGDRVFLPVWL